jgi:2-polyprenyl-3-methyl-5-hydroxy-6-metoxy-1,4-benzoquinol methylase
MLKEILNMTVKCRVCESNCFKDRLLCYSNMPSSAQGFLNFDELKSDFSSSLGIVQCQSCGLIQLDNEPVSYFKEVIRASAFSEEMRKFRLKQFKFWVKKFNLTDKKILEVGCGKGEYLEILSDAGADAYGIEYSRESVEYCIHKNLNVTQGFLGDKNSNINNNFDGFMCLSFMEHWPEPNKVLNGLSVILNEGAMGLIEVPNFDMILDDGLYSEFISDHLLYFTKETLIFTLQFNGFEVLSCESIWHNYILSAVVRKRIKTDLEFFEGFRSQVRQDLDLFIEKFPANKVAIWGAGHQALATISLTKIEKNIRYIVDSAIFKQGKYSPASHIKIVSEEELTKDPVDALIIMAGSYSKEIIKIMNLKYPLVELAVLREFGLEFFED